MPIVVRKELDNLTTEVTVSLARADYEPQFINELKKYRKQGSMKGFRKGKTPINTLKKMYGRSVLAEIVNKELNTALDGFLKEEKILYIGQPIPSVDTPEIDFNPRDLEDLEFKFDIGLSPQLDLKGLSKNKKFTKHVPVVSDEEIQTDIDAALKQLGERTIITDDIQDNDSLLVVVKELDGKEVKEGGIESEFTVLVEKLTKKAKKKIAAKKSGDSLTIDIFDLEEGLDEEKTRKYLLKIEDESVEIGKKFDLNIKEVSRVVPMTLGQEFYDKYFGEGVVSTEEDAKERFSQPIKFHYENNVKAMLFAEFQAHLMAKNDIALPTEFLKRWLALSNENLSTEDIENEFDGFAENLKWDIIKGHLAKENDIKIIEEEIIAEAQKKVMGYFGGATSLPPDMMKNMVERMLKDEKSLRQIEEEIISTKLYDVLDSKFGFKEKEVSIDDLKKIIEKANEAAEAKNKEAKAK